MRGPRTVDAARRCLELVPDGPDARDVQAVIDQLTNARLLTTTQETGRRGGRRRPRGADPRVATASGMGPSRGPRLAPRPSAAHGDRERVGRGRQGSERPVPRRAARRSGALGEVAIRRTSTRSSAPSWMQACVSATRMCARASGDGAFISARGLAWPALGRSRPPRSLRCSTGNEPSRNARVAETERELADHAAATSEARLALSEGQRVAAVGRTVSWAQACGRGTPPRDRCRHPDRAVSGGTDPTVANGSVRAAWDGSREL